MGRINEQIWGAFDTWVTPSGLFGNVGKVANFNGQGTNFQTAITEGILSLSEKIKDFSLSWCGLGEESNYTKMKLFANSTDVYGPGEVNVEHNVPTNFFFYFIPSGDNASPQACTMTGNNALYIWDPPATMQNANRYITPYTEFNIKKILWVVYVDCSQTVGGAISTFDYNDYKNNQMSAYPVINAIYAVPYVETSGDPITRSPNFGGNYPCTFKPAIFNGFSVYTPIQTDYFDDYAIFSKDRDYTLLLFGSYAQNINNRYTVGVGNCKRKYTSPRATYQDENLLDVLESALQTIACFGFYFVLDGIAHINDPLDSPYVYMGVIPSDGITHGVYTRGSDNRNNPNWDMEYTSNSNYDPTNVDNTNYNKTTGFNAPTVAHSFTKRYVLNAAAVQNLSGELWAAVNTQGAGVDTAEFNNKLFLTNNPIDCIISLQKFPLSDIGGGEPEFIKLGAYTSTVVRGRPHTNTLRVIQFNFDRSTNNGFVSKYKGSFLDREPYTSAVLYVPYCGTIQLDPADYMDKTITVTMILDYITGACTAYIAADNLVMTSLQGSCAIDLPVTGVQEMDLKAQIFNANQQLKAAKNQLQKTVASDVLKNIVDPMGAGSAMTGMVVGSKGGAAGAAIGGALTVSSTIPERTTSANTLYSSNLSVQNAKYNISHMEVPFKEVGGSSPCTSAALESCCRIIITRPLTKYDPTIYGHTVGYLCNLTGTIKNFHGYAEITAVDLSDVPCTAEEKAIIKQSLAKGVYLP